MSQRTLPPASASGRPAGMGTRPKRTEPGTLGPVRIVFDPARHCGAATTREGNPPCLHQRSRITADGRCGQHDGRSFVVVFDAAVHCGAKTNPLNDEAPCKNRKGFGTTHVGSGLCELHGGSSPNGAKAAAKEAAGQALAKLGVPVGSGDPFVLLSKTVSHAEGYLEATAQLAREATEANTPLVGLEAVADLYEQAIRTAARTGKAAVDADVADRLAALDERVDSLLWRFVGELLERVVPKAQRPAVETWAAMRLGELAAEYEHPVAVH